MKKIHPHTLLLLRLRLLMRRDATCLILGLFLLALPACPDVGMCLLTGVCPEVAPETTTHTVAPSQSLPEPPKNPKPTEEASQSTEPETQSIVPQSHVCCSTQVFCLDRDEGRCCGVCGAWCP